jgi:hypothetical protein
MINETMCETLCVKAKSKDIHTVVMSYCVTCGDAVQVFIDSAPPSCVEWILFERTPSGEVNYEAHTKGSKHTTNKLGTFALDDRSGINALGSQRLKTWV